MNDQGGYEVELKAEERAQEQERRMPKPHGDIVTDQDLIEWKKRKAELNGGNQ